MAIEIDIREDARFERRWFRVEMVAMAVMALLVAAGLAGGLGHGPLGPVKLRFPGGAGTVDHDRVLRLHTPTRVEIDGGRGGGARIVAVTLDSALLSGVNVQATSPQPRAMHAAPDGVVYLFDLGPQRRGRIVFLLDPGTPGRLTGRITVGGASLPLHMLVLP